MHYSPRRVHIVHRRFGSFDWVHSLPIFHCSFQAFGVLIGHHGSSLLFCTGRKCFRFDVLAYPFGTVEGSRGVRGESYLWLSFGFESMGVLG